jgi:hypothetical protein
MHFPKQHREAFENRTGSVSTRCVFTDFRVTAPVISLLTTHCYFVCPVITGSLNPKMKKDVANRISYNSFQIGPQKVDHCLLIISYRRKPPSNGRPAQHRSRCCCGVYQMQVFPSNKFPARPGNVAALSVRLATKIKVGESLFEIAFNRVARRRRVLVSPGCVRSRVLFTVY